MLRTSIPACGFLVLWIVLGVAGGPAPAAEEPPAPAAPSGHPTPSGTAVEAAVHDAAGEPNILEQQPSLAIWTVAVFLGLLFVLGKFAWKPLIEALHQREEHLEHVLLETERARNESEQLLAAHRRQMAEAEDRARALLEEAREQARVLGEELIQKARGEAEAEQQRARREIESARDNALSELWSKAADLAVSVAGKVMAKDLGEEDHRRLVASAIAEMPAAPSSVNGHRGGGGRA